MCSTFPIFGMHANFYLEVKTMLGDAKIIKFEAVLLLVVCEAKISLGFEKCGEQVW